MVVEKSQVYFHYPFLQPEIAVQFVLQVHELLIVSEVLGEMLHLDLGLVALIGEQRLEALLPLDCKLAHQFLLLLKLAEKRLVVCFAQFDLAELSLARSLGYFLEVFEVEDLPLVSSGLLEIDIELVDFSLLELEVLSGGFKVLF